jgi:hypothetical protein
LVITTSAWLDGSLRRASSVLIGGCRRSSSGPTRAGRVHRAESADAVHDLHATQSLELEVLLLVAVELEMLGEVSVGGKKEATRTAGGTYDDFARLPPDAVHDGGDERARRENTGRRRS